MFPKQNNESESKKRTGSSTNTSIGKINTHGLLLNKIVFSPPRDEDHYREIDIDSEVVNVRSNHNVITNQPVANTKSYGEQNDDVGRDDDYVVLDDVENGSIVKDDEFTSDQKFAPILKMNNTGKLKFFTKLQQVQPSLVPAASITGKIQFKPLNDRYNDELPTMGEERELDVLSSPNVEHEDIGGPVNSNHLKRKINIMEVDDDDEVLEKQNESNHSIRLGGGISKLNLKFDMSDSEDNENDSKASLSKSLKQHFTHPTAEANIAIVNKDNFGQSMGYNNEGDVSIDAVIRGEEEASPIASPDKRTIGDSNLNKIDSPLKNISINLNDNSDISNGSANKKKMGSRFGAQNMGNSLLDRNSSKFLRLSPSGNGNNFADKENYLNHIPSSPSILSSRKKLKSLPKLPSNSMNSPLLNVRMMSPTSKLPAELDLGMSSSLKSTRNNSPLKNHSVEKYSNLKQYPRNVKTQSLENKSKSISVSSYKQKQQDDIDSLMTILNKMKKNTSILSDSDNLAENSKNFNSLKQKYDLELEAKMCLDTQNEKLLSRVAQLEKDLSESYRTVTKLESQILNKNQQEVELQNKYIQLEKVSNEKIEMLEKEVEQLRKIRDKETQNEEKIIALTAERDSLLADVDFKNETIKTLKQSLLEFEKTQEENLSKLSTELYEQYSKKHEDKLNHLKQSYTQALNSLKKLVHSLRDEITKKNDEISKLKAQSLASSQTNNRRSNYHR